MPTVLPRFTAPLVPPIWPYPIPAPIITLQEPAKGISLPAGVGDTQLGYLAEHIRELTQENEDLKTVAANLRIHLHELQGQYATGDPRFYALLEALGHLHAKKAADYGDSDPLANIRASAELGIPPWKGALLRASDKIKRLWKFAKIGKLENESAEDSLIDLAAYSLIALILLQEEAVNAMPISK